MEKNQVSHMALTAAWIRGYHAAHDSPKIFNDFLAYQLLTEEERATFEQQSAMALKVIDPARAASCPDPAAALAGFMQIVAGPPQILSRSRYTEDILEKAVKQGIKQYVILGAGFDTFAFRCPDMLEQLQVFEVDHPATQAVKRQRLAESGRETPAQLHFVPVDFTKESLKETLLRSSFDFTVPTFFSWLGVTYYLPRETVFTMLRDIADMAAKASIVIFDYMDTEAFIPEKAAPRVQMLVKMAQHHGEPMKAGFEPSTLAVDLAPLGLRLHDDLSPSDIQERYFQGRTDGYYACEHVHFAFAVVE